MSQTKIRQSSQIFNSDLYDDSVAAGPALESGSTSLQQDLNALRSQMTRLQGGVNWFDALAGRSVSTLSTDLQAVEEKVLLYRAQILADVAVPATQDYVILSVASSQTPSAVASVGASLAEGAVVAFNATFGTATLAEVAGPNSISPRNLCVIRDAATGDPILSSGKVVFGLLQSESNVDGHVFDDTTSRAQISFVRENATGDDLELVPVADIEGQTINYSYALRVFLSNLPQDAYLAGVFVDVSAAANPTLQTVIDAQGNTAVNSLNATDVTFAASTYGWTFNTASGGSTAFGLSDGFRNVVGAGENHIISLPGIARSVLVVDGPTTYYELNSGFGSGAIVTYNVGDWSVTHNTAATFSGEVRAGIANNHVSLGALGEARVQSEGGSDLIVKGSLELLLDDNYKDSSTWGGSANGIPLADSIAEWSDYVSAFGNVSLLSSITSAGTSANQEKTVAVVTAAISANTDLQNGVNIDAALAAFSALSFVSNVDVYLNGQLMRNGADAAADFDVYPGTDPSVGEIRFEFDLIIGDVVTVIRHGAV